MHILVFSPPLRPEGYFVGIIHATRKCWKPFDLTWFATCYIPFNYLMQFTHGDLLSKRLLRIYPVVSKHCKILACSRPSTENCYSWKLRKISISQFRFSTWIIDVIPVCIFINCLKRIVNTWL